MMFKAIAIVTLYIFCCSEKVSGQKGGVNFWLYTKDNTGKFDYEVMPFDGKRVKLADNTLFDPSKPTKVTAHGNGGGTWIGYILNLAFAKAGLDYNVIDVDWRGLNGGARGRTDKAGEDTAKFLKIMS